MTDTNDKKLIEVAVPGEWALKKVFGPTLDAVGTDLKQLYQTGRDKVIAVAVRKIQNMDDKAQANLRVVREVFWNGAYTDEAICAEYFGGILAASRSQDGRDDSGIFYADIIKSLSSFQLHLHYVIYKKLNALMQECDTGCHNVNVGIHAELNTLNVFFSTDELVSTGLNIPIDLEAIYRKGLINEYASLLYEHKGKSIHYTKIVPTSLGIQLFAIVNNDLENWRSFPKKTYENFQNILLPNNVDFEINKLIEKVK